MITSLASPEEKDGRERTVVRFAYPDGDTYDLLVDPETGESTWWRSVADGRTTWTKLSDVRMVSGLRLAFRQETEGETARQAQTVTWEKVTVNAGLDDALFARPSTGASVVRLPSGRNATEWLAVDLYQKRWVYLRGDVNGVATDIVLDSGAGMTVLDGALAKKLGLRVEGELEARGTGGNDGAGIVSGVTVKLAGMEIGPLSAAVIDLAGVGKRVGRPLPLILGKELFHALVVDIDYPGSRIRFLDAATFRYDGPGRTLDLIPIEDGHKSLKLAIEGGAPVVVGLDTGQGGALTVELVAPGSPAAEAGWKEGERLAALDGEPAGENWWKTFTKLAEAKAGTEARFTLADGTERKLVLKEHY